MSKEIFILIASKDKHTKNFWNYYFITW